jgi:hypothetical protein
LANYNPAISNNEESIPMFKRLTRRSGNKKEDREQATLEDYPASIRSLIKRAVTDADEIVSSIKTKAQTEAEEEAARIISQAKQEAEEIKSTSEKAVQQEAEVIPSASSRKATEEKAEEPVQLQDETIEEKIEEPVQPQDEATEEKVEEAPVPEPMAAAEEELLRQPSPEEKADEAALPQQDSQSLYSGEVELAVGMPIELKMVSKLYNSLQTIPELRILHTTGSTNQGTIITIVLEKPLPLISELLSRMPEIKAAPELPGADRSAKGKKSALLRKDKKEIRRIRLVTKK